MTEVKAPRANSLADKVLACKNSHPAWGPKKLAEKVGCHPEYASQILRKYSHLLHADKSEKPHAEQPPTKTPQPKNSPTFKDGEVRGGNGKVNYSLKGVCKGGGPIAGLENVSMQFMIVDGNAAANVREAQAYISSMRAVLGGLEKVEEDMENPENLAFHALQVTNIMNAADRIKTKFLDTFTKREKDHKTFVEKTQKDIPRGEWVSEFNEAQPVEEKEESPAP